MMLSLLEISHKINRHPTRNIRERLIVIYKIRKGTNEDLDFLWEMLYQAIYVPEGEERPSREIMQDPSVRRSLDGWGRKGDLSLIATDELDKPVGSVWIRLFDESNKTYGYVDNQTPLLGIAMLPEYRGKGIGTLLMDELFKEARALGYQKISLSVDPNNPAVRLYQRYGFEKIGVDGTSWDMVAVI
jgi:[ribosomal protein S18]-alanine N-acetyltransferase